MVEMEKTKENENGKYPSDERIFVWQVNEL